MLKYCFETNIYSSLFFRNKNWGKKSFFCETSFNDCIEILIFVDEFAAKPFLGVPFTTKDSTYVGGKLHTLGLISRKTTVAKEDAECVRMAKLAGAIIVATTNIPEVNKWQETRNNLFGQTNNPYDTRRTVGGSSGGEAALIASCGSVFGLGSDIGGSVRMPGREKAFSLLLIVNINSPFFRIQPFTAVSLVISRQLE